MQTHCPGRSIPMFRFDCYTTQLSRCPNVKDIAIGLDWVIEGPYALFDPNKSEKCKTIFSFALPLILLKALNCRLDPPVHATTIFPFGSGCGSVGRAVTSNTRGPRFESSLRQKFIHIEHLFTVNCELKRQPAGSFLLIQIGRLRR